MSTTSGSLCNFKSGPSRKILNVHEIHTDGPIEMQRHLLRNRKQSLLNSQMYISRYCSEIGIGNYFKEKRNFFEKIENVLRISTVHSVSKLTIRVV